MGSVMLNKPTQATNELFNYLRDAALAVKNGDVRKMVQIKLQQNPELQRNYQMLMNQYPNMSPSQVCNFLFQQFGINPNMLGL